MNAVLKPDITYDEFSKLDVRVGLITNAERVQESEKLLKLSVDFGDFQRNILTGMQKWYSPEDFMGKKTLFVVNLAYRKMAGLISEGMLLSLGIDQAKKPILVFLPPETEVGEGLS